MIGGHQLGNHPAHRGADDVGAVDAERGQQRRRVGGHVGEVVGGRSDAALGIGRQHRAHVRRPGGVELFR